MPNIAPRKRRSQKRSLAIGIRSLQVEQLENRRVLFGFTVHPEITATALPFLQASIQDELKSATEFQDTFGQFSQTNHFDGCNFSGTAANIRTWYNDAVASLDPANFDAVDAAFSFGKILHAIQDFYSHSNWVELQNVGWISTDVLFDSTTGTFPAMTPYSLLGGSAYLIEGESETPFGPGSSVSRVPDTYHTYFSIGDESYVGVVTGCVNPFLYGGDESPDSISVSHGGPAGDPFSFGALAKDEPDSEDAALNAKHNQARALAERQTFQEFRRLTELVRAAYGEAGAAKFAQAWVNADYGDAPAAYGTVGHVIGGPRFGALRESEPTSQFSASANGDDNLGQDDDDGVTFGNLLQGQTKTFTLNVQGLSSGASAAVAGWIDFNGDGDFNDATEKILSTTRSANGAFTFDVTLTSAMRGEFKGLSIARFRVADASENLNSPASIALSGEVEDYQIGISEAPWSTVAIVDGRLDFVDQLPGGKDDNLIISAVSGGYQIRETTGKEIFVSGIAGATGSGTSQVTIPASGAFNKIRFLTQNGADTVTIDTANGSDPIPSGGLDAALGGGFDTVRLANNNTINTWRIRTVGGGDVAVGNLGTVFFSAIQQLDGDIGEDRFDVVSLGAAGMNLNGGGGTKDIFLSKADENYTLSNSKASIVKGSVSRDFLLSGIEIANLIGGDSNNFMNALAFSGRAILDGGKGNDHLRSGNGNDLLLGREGDDILIGTGGDDQIYGDAGRDIIAGGEGTDLLDGGVGEDILLGGRYDQEHVKAAMDTIMATWRETTSYTTRVSKLRDVGVGPTKQYRLSIQTVLDDEKTDNMIGASDLDWFFAQSNAAFLGFENPGRTSGETLTSIKPKKQ